LACVFTDIFSGIAVMVDETRATQEIYGITGRTLEKAAYGGVLFALVVFGLFKDLLG
jgi:hypothetical protein